MNDILDIDFNKPNQNSILITKIKLFMKVDYLTIYIECVYNKNIKLLVSKPIIYEPENDLFFYKCFLPINCYPTLNYNNNIIEYVLYINLFKDTIKLQKKFNFQVYNTSQTFKYDLFINRDMIRIDSIINNNNTICSEIVNFMRNYKFNTDNCFIINNVDFVKKVLEERIYVLKCVNKDFKEIINKLKNNGDIFFYLQKNKITPKQQISCEIKSNNEKIMILKYDKVIKKNYKFEFIFFKNFNVLKIILVKDINDKKCIKEIVNLQCTNILYKKIKMKNFINDYNINSLYIKVKIYFKIYLDDFKFNIYPIFVQNNDNL